MIDLNNWKFEFFLHIRICKNENFAGNLPCPLIYGATVDSACSDWGSGGYGACHSYDGPSFRYYFHGEFSNDWTCITL